MLPLDVKHVAGIQYRCVKALNTFSCENTSPLFYMQKNAQESLKKLSGSQSLSTTSQLLMPQAKRKLTNKQVLQKPERRKTMSKLNLTPEEEMKVLEILERYLPELEHEAVHTDNKSLRKFFMERKEFMKDLMRRLKS